MEEGVLLSSEHAYLSMLARVVDSLLAVLVCRGVDEGSLLLVPSHIGRPLRKASALA